MDYKYLKYKKKYLNLKYNMINNLQGGKFLNTHAYQSNQNPDEEQEPEEQQPEEQEPEEQQQEEQQPEEQEQPEEEQEQQSEE